MSTTVCGVLGFIAAVVLVIMVYALIMPNSKKKNLGKFGRFLHDFFRIKKLYVEAILRFLYVFISIHCVTNGFFLLFGKTTSMWFFSSKEKSTFGAGLALIILGPIITRLIFEIIMISILKLTKLQEISDKLDGKDSGESIFASANELTERFSQVAVSTASVAKDSIHNAMDSASKGDTSDKQEPSEKSQNVRYCLKCGTAVDDGDFCPKCGTKLV